MKFNSNENPVYKSVGKIKNQRAPSFKLKSICIFKMHALLYGLASCLMIFVNKIAATSVNSSMLLFVQTFVSSHLLGFVMVFQNETLQLTDVKSCFWYVILSLLGMYMNIQALVYNDIKIVLMMRGICPIIIFPIELAMRKIQMPNFTSNVSLIFMLASISAFAYSSVTSVSLIGMAWGISYSLCVCLSIITQNIISKNKNAFAMSFYTNQISTLFMFAMVCKEVFSQTPISKNNNFTDVQTTAISLSCILGACINYLGWKCQQTYSALYMSIINASSKILVIIITRLISEEEMPLMSTVAIVIYFISLAFFKTEKMHDELKENLISK